MDFLKTLLIYMTMTFAMTVQEAPAPGQAPEVTAVPAYVQAQSIGTQAPDEPAATATPKATATAKPTNTPEPTRSAPTITPNTRYKTIQYGDRGSDVKQLQQRLIALGYMKTGSDDGSYGYQTLNAVRDFQKANGLTADGAAGRVTLTCLYEDPNVVTGSLLATATPAPTDTPAPETQAPQGNAVMITDGTTATTTEETRATSITAGWTAVEDGTVLLNGDTLVLLTRQDGVIAQRKPSLWLYESTVMISLDDLIAAGSWKLGSGSIDNQVFTIAGYQVNLVAVDDTSSGTCQSYTALVDGNPVALNDGDVICSRGSWYATPAFLIQVAGANVTWDGDEETLVIVVQEKSVASSVD